MRHIVLLLTLCIALAISAKDRFAYVYNYGSVNGTLHMKGELQEGLRIHKTLGTGRYLWARLDGREYLIDDDAVLDSLDEAMKPQRAIQRELDKLENEMDALERRADRLEDELDDLSDRDSDYNDLTPAEKTRMLELEVRLREAQRALRPYEERERALERREEEIDRQVDAAIKTLVERAVRNGTAQRYR